MESFKAFSEIKEGQTSFQDSIHKPSTGEDLYSPFYTRRKTPWYHPWPEILRGGPVGSRYDVEDEYYGDSVQNRGRVDDVLGGKISRFVFNVNIRPHGLTHTIFKQRLPAITAHPGYRVSWVRDIGSAIIRYAEIRLNDGFVTSVDIHTITDSIQTRDVDYSEIEVLDRRRGNIRSLRTPSESLPSTETSFTIPWCFSTDISNFFPLCYCGYRDNLEIRMDLIREFQDLVDVTDVSGQKVPFDSRSIATIAGIKYEDSDKGPAAQLPNPSVWGWYLGFDNSELNYNLRVVGLRKDRRDIRLMIETTSIVSETSTEPSLSVSINSEGYPVHQMSWVLLDSRLALQGRLEYMDTISISKIKGIGGQEKVFPASVTSSDYPSLFLKNRMPANGIHVWTTWIDRTGLTPPPGVVIKDGMIGVTLIGKGLGGTGSHGTQGVQGGRRLLVNVTKIKQLRFTQIPKSESDRETFRAQYVIEGSN